MDAICFLPKSFDELKFYLEHYLFQEHFSRNKEEYSIDIPHIDTEYFISVSAKKNVIQGLEGQIDIYNVIKEVPVRQVY